MDLRHKPSPNAKKPLKVTSFKPWRRHLNMFMFLKASWNFSRQKTKVAIKKKHSFCLGFQPLLVFFLKRLIHFVKNLKINHFFRSLTYYYVNFNGTLPNPSQKACFAVHATKRVVKFYDPIYSVRDVWLPLRSAHRRIPEHSINQS